MARRRHKKRTHVGAQNGPSTGVPPNSSAVRGPKTMVIRMGAGDMGSSVSQLVKDVRSMMEPDTASRLKERKSNRLRDYTTMAGPLGISHLLLFSRSSTGNTNLRLALFPRGPTLHFRVERYSLCKDVRKALRHPKGGGKDYLSPPLLVMNNFVSPEEGNQSKHSVPKHLETLSTTLFQSLFPPISPQSTPLSSIRRVLLLDRQIPKSTATADFTEASPYVINLRHYAIVTKPTGLSRGVRRINAAARTLKERASRKGMPNLGNLEDVADYILDPSAAGAGFTSGSESEMDTDAEVEVLDVNRRKVLSKKQVGEARKSEGDGQHGVTGAQKRAVKLVELGPRMTLRMTKVEEGVCGGKVMWHEYLSKSEDEIKEMESVWETRKREKAERKRVQKENVEKKRKANASTGEATNEVQEGALDEDDSDDSEGWDDEVSETEQDPK
ncbi:MAG: hypothetical protein L6R38_005659 [Xanthoria sp. 2 TBL-2021]|nr:MAG: hypothetical protein L6R38_005659 [Xanthoria sp. 2 TBL-2021]